jgi:hypothetical protein
MIRLLAVSFALVLVLAPAAHAETIVVDTNGDVAVGDAADCLDGTTATPCNVRDALVAAAGTDEDDRVVVPAGPYVLTGGPLVTSGAFDIRITGSGSNVTNFDGDDLSRVFTLNADTSLEHVAIRDGRDGARGGAILAAQGTLTLRESLVESNEAGTGPGQAGEGGGIAIEAAGASLIEDSIVRDNRAGAIGGGIWTATGSGPLTVVDSAVETNRAEPATGGFAQGGGLSTRGALTLTRATVTGNVASAFALTDEGATGGGATVLGPLEVTDSTISGNTATGLNGGEGRGGGLYLSGVDAARVRGSTIAGNTAAASGGIAEGGGIRKFGASVLEITNSTISGNTVSATASALGATGGGATLDAGTLVNVTLAGNSATGTGAEGGSLNAPDAALRNTIVSGGDCTGPVATAVSSIDSGATCGLNRSSVDPRLGPLAANGGPTETHALLTGSPAIEGGTAAGAPTTDQRGVRRPQGARIDVGAFELEGVAVPRPPTSPRPPAADRTAPAFTAGLALAPRRFRARTGSSVSFGLSEAATVTLRIERRTTGRRVRGRCVKRTDRNRTRRRCVRYVRVGGTITHAAAAGTNRLAFTRALRPARYRLVAIAVDAAGNRSRPARATFRILRRR